MLQWVTSHAFVGDTDSSDLFVLLSLARGELVKLKLPVDKAPNGGLVFDGPALRQIRFP